MPITEIKNNLMPSLSEWLDKAGISLTQAFREEDNAKRDRLEVLYQEIGLVYDRPERLTARDIVDNTPLFQDILSRKGDDKCALRLIPLDPTLPKLRNRGKTLKENLVWFSEQQIDPNKYKAEVVPHDEDTPYSAILFVTSQGVWGEIIPGNHWKLTQGLFETPPVSFSRINDIWQFSAPDLAVERVVKKAVASLCIADQTQRHSLATKLNAQFTAHNEIIGYFEFIVLKPEQIVFIDYNRVLTASLNDLPVIAAASQAALSGLCASRGQAEGKVQIVRDPATDPFAEGDILVCDMTMVDYIPLMKKAAAIVAAQGNVLSHAAIVSRELKKPCLVGVKDVMTILKNGDLVRVDATNGMMEKI